MFAKPLRVATATLIPLALISIPVKGQELIFHKEHVQVFMTPYKTRVYEFIVAYEVLNQDSVFVRGLGSIKSVGFLSIYSSNSTLVFMSGPSGNILDSIDAERTGVRRALDLPEPFPSDADFEDAREVTIRRLPQERFLDALFNTFDRYNLQAVIDYQGGTTTTLKTLFTPLDIPPDSRITGDIALSVTFPLEGTIQAGSLEIKYVLREKRRLSRYRIPAREEEVINAGYDFIRRFVRDLSNDGGPVS